jgi:hypothetical protein
LEKYKLVAKYRTLELAELEELKKEFVDFLVLNGIPADEWELIKRDNKESALATIELFSDVVFESILRKVKFLEFRNSNHLHVFQCLPDQLILVAMEANENEEIDFLNPDFISSSMLTPPKEVKVFTTTKSYSKTREMELFELIQNGCTITDDRLFKALCLAL